MSEELMHVAMHDQNLNQTSPVAKPKKRKASWVRTILWMLSMMVLANIGMAIIAYFLFFRK